MSKAGKFISEHTSNCYNYNSYAQDPIPWLTQDQARKAVEIAKKEIYEWLINHNDYIIANGSITRFDMEKCIKDLKQAMKDE